MLLLLHYKRCDGMFVLQGLEFVWGDGSHKYPDEYPAEDTEIEVQGTFETYKEKDYDTTFCRLANVDMRVKE